MTSKADKNKTQSSPTRRSKRNFDLLSEKDDADEQAVTKNLKLGKDSDLEYEDDFHSTRSGDGSDDEYVNESGSGAEDEDDEEEVQTKPKLKENSSSSSQPKKKLPVKGLR